MNIAVKKRRTGNGSLSRRENIDRRLGSRRCRAAVTAAVTVSTAGTAAAAAIAATVISAVVRVTPSLVGGRIDGILITFTDTIASGSMRVWLIVVLMGLLM